MEETAFWALLWECKSQNILERSPGSIQWQNVCVLWPVISFLSFSLEILLNSSIGRQRNRLSVLWQGIRKNVLSIVGELMRQKQSVLATEPVAGEKPRVGRRTNNNISSPRVHRERRKQRTRFLEQNWKRKSTCLGPHVVPSCRVFRDTHKHTKRNVLCRREQKHEDKGGEHCEDGVCGPLVLLTSVQRKVTNLLQVMEFVFN